jgi:hypothetical protein
MADAAVALKIEPHSLGAKFVVTIVGRISFRLEMI